MAVVLWLLFDIDCVPHACSCISIYAVEAGRASCLLRCVNNPTVGAELTFFPMTNFHPTATTAPATAALPLPAHQQLGALLATVKRLVSRADALSCTALQVQDQMDDLLETLDQDEPDTDNLWVRQVAKTPAQVEAEHRNSPDGSRPCYVVYVGREPGLYFTHEEADAQIKGVPNQQYRRRASKAEGLFLYTQFYENVPTKVEKWEEILEGQQEQQ
ncbi:hypothetical protein DFH06DRAFT_1350773 [Mycena polygramma]|nr:hypothetical protein DFH06DRAFT_1350773 [Mycena polygramma]